MDKINIVLAGPRGNMGKEAIKMITKQPHYRLVAVIDRKQENKETEAHQGHKVYYDAEQCFQKEKPHIFIELTRPEAGFLHTKLALENNIKTVVGTSGFSEEQISQLSKIATQNKVGCIIAPNFALGAVLMMLFAKMAANYFPNIEIIEKHHDGKVDAPSGTAIKTAEMIQEVRDQHVQGHPEEYETLQGVRGGDLEGIKVHSVRLPGLVAHQEVIFGGNSELLTIRHDSIHRASFMDGIKLAIDSVLTLEHLVYGLENVMELKIAK